MQGSYDASVGILFASLHVNRLIEQELVISWARRPGRSKSRKFSMDVDFQLLI